MARYPKGSRVIRLGDSGHYCLVDAWLYPLLSRYSWYAHKSRSAVYARATIDGRKTFMHTLVVLGVPGVRLPRGYQTDHKDWNTLNNMVSNLRVVTEYENQRNRRPRRRAVV